MLYGTILAPDRSVDGKGTINGALIAGGKDIDLHGGSAGGSHGGTDGSAGETDVGGDDLTETLGDPVAITFDYTGPTAATILVTSKTDPADPKGVVFFEGAPDAGGQFVVDAANGGEDDLPSNIYVHVQDTNGNIESVQIHTSGSQPLNYGDTFSGDLNNDLVDDVSLELTGYVGDDDTVGGSDGGPAEINYIPFGCCGNAPDEPATPGISGYLFNDANNDGVKNIGEAPIAGVTVALTGTTADGDSVDLTTTTDQDGFYQFVGLASGQYVIEADQTAGSLDGAETVGSAGGTVDNTADSQAIGNVPYTAGSFASGYNFGEVEVAGLSGLVFDDANGDGSLSFGERAIESAVIQLTGVDDRGNPVDLSDVTDVNGIYGFVNLRPGTYHVAQDLEATTAFDAALADFIDGGLALAGGAGGTAEADGNQVSDIELASGQFDAGYDFAEANRTVESGQTATISFWRSNDGKKLIEGLNGDKKSKMLGNHLADSFPNLFGDLAGKKNSDVWKSYQKLHDDKVKALATNDASIKLEVEVMSLALAMYVTDQSHVEVKYKNGAVDPGLVTKVESYGFLVEFDGQEGDPLDGIAGVADETYNLTTNGDAFLLTGEVAGSLDYVDMTIQAILERIDANTNTLTDLVHDTDGDGEVDESDPLELVLRQLANNVVTAINHQGGF